MTEQKNNQDLTKVYELIQKENRWNRIANFSQTVLMLIPTFILIWKSFKGQKLSPKRRLIRNKAAQARLQLEEKLILEEALHEAELKHMETGLDSSQTGLEGDGKSDFLTSLKQKSESFVKNKMGQVKEKVTKKTFDSLNQASDKFTSSMDKDQDEKK